MAIDCNGCSLFVAGRGCVLFCCCCLLCVGRCSLLSLMLCCLTYVVCCAMGCVVCCGLIAVCGLMCSSWVVAVCCSLRVVRCLLFVVRCLLVVLLSVGCLLRVGCCEFIAADC